jgi:hypothetical protein
MDGICGDEGAEVKYPGTMHQLNNIYKDYVYIAYLRAADEYP